jgi:hypothetical protein
VTSASLSGAPEPEKEDGQRHAARGPREAVAVDVSEAAWCAAGLPDRPVHQGGRGPDWLGGPHPAQPARWRGSPHSSRPLSREDRHRAGQGRLRRCAAASTLERVTIVTPNASTGWQVVVRMRQPHLRSSEKAKDTQNDRDDLRAATRPAASDIGPL